MAVSIDNAGTTRSGLHAARLEDTRQAFDAVAAVYAQSNAANRVLREMRRQTLAAVMAHAAPGCRVIDLGCGPGCDAEALAHAGRHVTAIDWSPAMVDQARLRIARARLEDWVVVRQLGIHELASLAPASFDAAYSNFGPLNCVPHLADAARLIADRLRPGGVLVASAVGRVCPWELALYCWRRDWTRLRVRYAREFVPVPLSGGRVWTRYYSPGEFERCFRGAGFRRISLRALGVFVPPPYMHAFVERHPALVAALQRLEHRAGGWPGVRAWGDHFLMVLRTS